MRNGFVFVSLALLLGGCSFNPFVIDGYAVPPAYDVQIVDQRSDLSKAGGRESLGALPRFHGDDMFVPGKLELFRGALAQAFETPPQQVTVLRFDVVDVPAKTIPSIQSGSMASISIVGSILLAPDADATDFITCTIEALVDGRLVESSSRTNYALKATDTMIYNQPVYVAAVDKVVKESLDQWIEEAAQGADIAQ